MGGWGDTLARRSATARRHGDGEKNFILLRIPEFPFLRVLFLLPQYSSIPTFHYSRYMYESKSRKDTGEGK